MGFTITTKGDWKQTLKFLNHARKVKIADILERYAQEGANALATATPTESGTTQNSWTYEVTVGSGSSRIDWCNSNIKNGYNIAVLIQTGHGLRQGGYVEGIDYINPTMKPIFQAIADAAWQEVIGV